MGGACRCLLGNGTYVYVCGHVCPSTAVPLRLFKRPLSWLAAAPYLTGGDQSITKQLWLRLQMASGTQTAAAAGTGLAGSLCCRSESRRGGGPPISATPTLSLFRDAPHVHTCRYILCAAIQYIHVSIYLICLQSSVHRRLTRT